MAYFMASEAELQSIADAIRTRGGTSLQLEFPNGFVSAIQNIDEPYPATAKAISQTASNGTANGPSSPSSSPTKVTKTFTMNRANVYAVEFRRYGKLGSYYGIPNILIYTYAYDGEKWTVSHNGSSGSWAVPTLNGDTLTLSLSASYGYYVTSNAYNVAQIRNNT